MSDFMIVLPLIIVVIGFLIWLYGRVGNVKSPQLQKRLQLGGMLLLAAGLIAGVL